MPTIGSRRPFIELVEVVQNELVREAASGEEAKYKGFINQTYTNELPALLPERYIRKEAYVTLAADYTTGTVTVGTGTTNIIGASTSWTSANSDDRLIKVDGHDRLYRVTFGAGTDLTFQDSLTWTSSSGSGLEYVLLKDRYALDSSFDYLVTDDNDDPNVVHIMQQGAKLFLDPMTNEAFDRVQNQQFNDPPSHYTIKWTDLSGTQTPYIHVWPAPDVDDIIGYNYVPLLVSMTEYTTGTVTFAATTAVIGAGSPDWSTNVTTGSHLWFIRNDTDGTGSSSLWSQVSSVANATALTLSAAFTGTTGTGQSYTIANVSKFPSRFDDAMMYQAALLVDPDNINAAKWQSMFQQAIGIDRQVESKRKRSETLKNFGGVLRRGNTLRRGNLTR